MLALLPKYPDWTAIIAGWVAPEHRKFADSLKTKIDGAGLADRIVFLGEVDDVKIWYRRFSLCVAPSRNEGFGLTPLEAMASETAVVASDAGAYAEMVVPGETGMVVPAGNGKALENAIEPYLADPELARAHAANAVLHVRNSFDIGSEVEGLRRVYTAIWSSGR
jgi:mannosyltransferase